MHIIKKRTKWNDSTLWTPHNDKANDVNWEIQVKYNMDKDGKVGL